MNYENSLLEFFNKVLSDELTASILYKRMSQMTVSPKLQEELLRHSQEEFNHFNVLLEFAYNHGFGETLSFEINQEIVSNVPTDPEQILNIVQNLERIAIDDYKRCALIARQESDLETEEFMIGLMKYEQQHFDDLSQFNGQKRSLSFIERLKGF